MELLAGWQGPGLEADVGERLTRRFLSAINPSCRRSVLEPASGTTLLAAGDGGNLLEYSQDSDSVFAIGSPHFAAGNIRSIDGCLQSLAEQARDDPDEALAQISGCYALLIHERRSGRTMLATDRFGSIPIYYFLADDGSLVFNTNYASLLNHPLIDGKIDQQSVYNYVFFSTVPSDRCIHRGIRRIPPSSVLVCKDGRVDVRRYWMPNFNRANPPPASELQHMTRGALSDSVARFTSLEQPGCFLSGGLDSSAVAGMAAKHSGGKPFRAYTMGFTEAEFDETTYARTAAERFGLDLHEHRITADELVQTIDTITGAFAEPFGNSSAISSYIGAKVAREDGILNILAGDGGDELFAGNERYQKQLVFELYNRVPRALRASILNPFAKNLAALPGPFRKVSSYIRQAIIPLPARLFTYNLLVRNDPSEILSPVFLKEVDIEQPFRFLQSLFDEPADGDTLDRLMFLDWTVTLTDNDLRKVRTTCEAAGLHVHFPMLEHSVVDTSLRVPSQEKMTLRTLRAFYKKAFTGFLPERILHKQKHGFGVPVGPWIAQNTDLRERVYGRLGALKERDIIQPDYIDNLIHLHQTDHAVYYGALLWPLFMLEEWFQAHPHAAG